MREIRLLQRLSHQNILQLQTIIGGKSVVYMVFDYLDHDLTGLLSHPTFTYQPEHVKCLMQQMFGGLHYLHSQGILHRDIKGKVTTLLLYNHDYCRIKYIIE